MCDLPVALLDWRPHHLRPPICKECITLWFRAHHNCPVCKRQLVQGDLHDITLKPQELKVHTESVPDRGESHSQQVTPSKKVSTIYSEFNPEQLAEIKNIDLDGPNFTTRSIPSSATSSGSASPTPAPSPSSSRSTRSSSTSSPSPLTGTASATRPLTSPTGPPASSRTPAPRSSSSHARAHASGLNLVNASHVFLCEPLLNTALELQAIARVDRIGQQHETTVWLYLVDGTVEESIYNLSVQRRMEHMGRTLLRGKSKEGTPGAAGREPGCGQCAGGAAAQLTKLMGKDGISGGRWTRRTPGRVCLVMSARRRTGARREGCPVARPLDGSLAPRRPRSGGWRALPVEG